MPTHKLLHTRLLSTPLGHMIAVADEHALYLLEFADRPDLNQEIEKLTQAMHADIILGATEPEPINSIKAELNNYFKGRLTTFTTPIALLGTPFQNNVWQCLKQIPYGCTYSYAQIAAHIGKPNTYRAVARANSTNQLALIVPCHRVISADGSLNGYAGGIERKKWLIEHEKTIVLL